MSGMEIWFAILIVWLLASIACKDGGNDSDMDQYGKGDDDL